MKKILVFSLLLAVLNVSAQEIDIQGHRGARGLLPENTIPAFLRAIDEGVTTLELDVVITKDKQVVVSHEPYMSSTICSTPQGDAVRKDQTEEFNIYEMTYEEVRAFDCGSRGNSRFPDQRKMKVSKPLLKDLIDEVEKYLEQENLPKVGYNIELKSQPRGDNIAHPGVEEFSQLVHDLLSETLSKERFTIQCFDFRILKHWHKEYPDVRLVALVENNRGIDKNLEELGFTPEVYSPYHVLLNKKKIKKIQSKGMKVIPWTVNKIKRMQELVDMGVDGIITDYPDRAKALEY